MNNKNEQMRKSFLQMRIDVARKLQEAVSEKIWDKVNKEVHKLVYFVLQGIKK